MGNKGRAARLLRMRQSMERLSPGPIFILATYNEVGTPDTMNAGIDSGSKVAGKVAKARWNTTES